MKFVVFDVENTVTKKEGDKIDLSPYSPFNSLVSVGYLVGSTKEDVLSETDVKYYFINHSEVPDPSFREHLNFIQEFETADLIIGHNLKHDLAWMKSMNVEPKDDCKFHDTMLTEYLFDGGQKTGSYSLDELAKRYNVSLKKTDLIDKNMSFYDIQKEIVEEYGRGDVWSTYELYCKQAEKIKEEDYQSLSGPHDMIHQFMRTLLNIQSNGIKIDQKALIELEQELIEEKARLEEEVGKLVDEVMGDRAYRISSPDDLSAIVYSRKPVDKKEWKEFWNIGTNERGKKKHPPKLNRKSFVDAVNSMTTLVKREEAKRCTNCNGEGKIFRKKKDGTSFKKPSVCPECGGLGMTYTNTPVIAGFGMAPSNANDVTASGFATKKQKLEQLAEVARSKKKEKAARFFTAMIRINALDTYISNFCAGIRIATQDNGILHPNFNQHIAATQRLSSSEPNFQNLPKRGEALPIRKVVVSRWEEGSIFECDFSQLEFRVAGCLAFDERVLEDVTNGVDVHRFTASVLNNVTEEEVTKDMRNYAKADTFKPLYGGTFGTPEQMAYYAAFKEKYPGIAQYQSDRKRECLNHKKMVMPDGKQFRFPKIDRYPTKDGSIRTNHDTQICNYPVQYFATGLIVPLAVINLEKRMKEKEMKSLIINTVHDSIVVDCYPGEEEFLKDIMPSAMLEVEDIVHKEYGFRLTVPLAVELDAGPNWKDLKAV